MIRRNTFLRASVTLVLVSSSACSLPHADQRLDAAQDTPSPSDVIAEDRIIAMDVADAQPDSDASSMDADAAMIDADDARADTGADVMDADVMLDSGVPVDSDVIVDSGACAPPTMACGGGCVDTQTSLAHCGRCGNACGAAELCRAGACTAPRDCAELLATRPTTTSGTYLIDHDSDGLAPIMLFCDMSTPSGAWTEVFRASNTNYAASVDVALRWRLTRALSDRSTRMLIAFRTSTGAIAEPTSVTTFPIPTEIRSENPFATDQRDIANVNATVNGASVVGTLRYGSRSFSGMCADAWIPAAWGRFCLQGSRAPFFAAWAAMAVDNCSQSDQRYSTTECATERQFSVAVAP